MRNTPVLQRYIAQPWKRHSAVSLRRQPVQTRDPISGVALCARMAVIQDIISWEEASLWFVS